MYVKKRKDTISRLAMDWPKCCWGLRNDGLQLHSEKIHDIVSH